MRIGKNIHTENKKKVYRKPVVDVVEVDRVIVLGASSIEDMPDEVSSHPGQIDKQATSEEKENIFPKSQTPFGGGTPDYER